MELRWAAAREGKLLSFLRRELRLSAGLCKRLKYDHAFAVNGTPVYTDHPVRPGDIITVRLSEPPRTTPPSPAHWIFYMRTRPCWPWTSPLG